MNPSFLAASLGMAAAQQPETVVVVAASDRDEASLFHALATKHNAPELAKLFADAKSAGVELMFQESAKSALLDYERATIPLNFEIRNTLKDWTTDWVTEIPTASPMRGMKNRSPRRVTMRRIKNKAARKARRKQRKKCQTSIRS